MRWLLLYGCTISFALIFLENESNKLQANDMDLNSSMKTSALASLSFCYQSSSDSEDEDDNGIDGGKISHRFIS